jgi:hypothetical protein
MVAVNFDLEIEKVISVAVPETVGEPLLGKAEVTYEPKFVTIKGPQSKLEEQKILRTEPVNVEGATGSFNVRLKILTEGEAEVWHIEPDEVTAHINIVTEAVSKEWKHVKVLALLNSEYDGQIEFSPEFVDVSLHGSPQTINSISEDDISVFADCAEITTHGSHKIRASIHLPPGISLSAAIEPPVVTAISKPRAKPDRRHEVLPQEKAAETNAVTIIDN